MKFWGMVLLITSTTMGCGTDQGNSTGTRGGGDIDAAIFLHYAKQIAGWMKQGDLKGESVTTIEAADVAKFGEVAQHLVAQMDRETGPTVIFVRRDLKDDSGSPKMAVFEREPVTVWVNRKNWSELETTDRYVLVALEIFGIIGAENRYAVTDLITQNIREISGISDEQNFPHLTIGGYVFYEHGRLQKTAANFIYYTMATFPQVDPLDAEEETIGGETKLMGLYLTMHESKRIEQFEELADYFLYMPAQYQLDVWISTVAQYQRVGPRGGQTRTHLGFEPILETLSQPISDYLEASVEMMERFLEVRHLLKPEVAGEIEKIRDELVAYGKVFGGSIPNRPSITPYQAFFHAAFSRMRAQLHRGHCKVPSTFELNFYEDEVADLLSSADLVDWGTIYELYEEAHTTTEKTFAGISATQRKWQAIVDAGYLKNIEIKDPPSESRKQDLVAGTSALLEVVHDYMWAYSRGREHIDHGDTSEVSRIMDWLYEMDDNPDAICVKKIFK